MIPENNSRNYAFADRRRVTPQKLSGFASIVDSSKKLVVDNPMLDESKRASRKLFSAGKHAQFISIALFLIVYLWLNAQTFLGNADSSTPFFYIELILLTLIIPTSVYTAISGEREHATWDALVLTRLTAGQIIVGKLLWRFRTILIIAAFCLGPIIISRIKPDDPRPTVQMVILTQILLFCWGQLLCTFGLYISSVTKRSITSLAVISLIILGFLIALPTLYNMFFNVIDPSGGNGKSDDMFNQALLTLNPFVCLPTLLGNAGYRSVYPGANIGVFQIIVYEALSAVFLLLTYVRLRILEMPGNGRR